MLTNALKRLNHTWCMFYLNQFKEKKGKKHNQKRKEINFNRYCLICELNKNEIRYKIDTKYSHSLLFNMYNKLSKRIL